jgi:hypothetical protein
MVKPSKSKESSMVKHVSVSATDDNRWMVKNRETNKIIKRFLTHQDAMNFVMYHYIFKHDDASCYFYNAKGAVQRIIKSERGITLTEMTKSRVREKKKEVEELVEELQPKKKSFIMRWIGGD